METLENVIQHPPRETRGFIQDCGVDLLQALSEAVRSPTDPARLQHEELGIEVLQRFAELVQLVRRAVDFQA